MESISSVNNDHSNNGDEHSDSTSECVADRALIISGLSTMNSYVTKSANINYGSGICNRRP